MRLQMRALFEHMQLVIFIEMAQMEVVHDKYKVMNCN